MKAVLEEIREKNLKIDKSKWTRVKFGQVAFQKKDSIDRDNTDVKFYVKGEHMESEDLHIRQWGELADEYLGPAFIRRFESGDILYGSRRTYLKKVAVAHFDGITSNTTFVINANEKLIIKELLPFVMLSEGFTQHSIKNSKGSVNPYINWKDIANYEFLLPPKDQQARLAELLWAADEVVEASNNLLQSLKNLRSNFFNNSLFRVSRKNDQAFGSLKSLYPVENLGELIEELQYGISQSLEDPTGIPVLRMNNLQDGNLLLDDLKYYQPKNNELARFMLKKGDLLFNRTNSFELVGKVSLFDVDGEYSFASYLIRIATNKEKVNPIFLNYYLNSPIGMAKIRSHRTPGVSQSNINAQNLKLIPVPVPGIDIQNLIVDKIAALSKSEQAAKLRIHSTKKLQKSLISQMF